MRLCRSGRIFDRREKRRMRGRSLTSTTSSGASRHLPLIGEGTQAQHIAFLHAADQKPSLGGRWRLSRRRRRRMREKKATLPSKLGLRVFPHHIAAVPCRASPKGSQRSAEHYSGAHYQKPSPLIGEGTQARRIAYKNKRRRFRGAACCHSRAKALIFS